MTNAKNAKKVKAVITNNLTGAEAGRLWLIDSWEVDRDREGILTEAEVARLRKNLRTDKDVLDYNRYVDLYKGLDWIIKEAQIAFLQASYLLENICNIGQRYIYQIKATLALRRMPLIVTEKQLKDLKAEQKKAKLKRLHNLDEAIVRQAWHHAPEDYRQRVSLDTYLFREEEDPEIPNAEEAYRTAEAEIMALVEAGKLRPIEREAEVSIEEDNRLETSHFCSCSDPWPGRKDEYGRLFVSAQELVKAGLPSWREMAEEFNLWQIAEEHQQSDSSPNSLAVLQDIGHLSDRETDKRGHYENRSAKILGDITLIRALEDERGRGFTEECQDKLETALDRIQKVIARIKVLEEAAPLVGLDCTEDVDMFYADLAERVRIYNLFANDLKPDTSFKEALDLEQEHEAEGMDVSSLVYNRNLYPLSLPRIHLDKMKPKRSDLSYVRHLLTYTLGENWWRQPIEEADDAEE